MGENLDWDSIMREAQSRQWESRDQLDAWIRKKTQAYNSRPQKGLSGLSPNRAQRLFADDWSGEGPIRLNEALTLSELRSAAILNNARTFLGLLETEGPAKATAALKNLSRAFVAKMIEAWQGDEDVLDQIAEFNKKNDEEDVYPIHTLRIVLEMAGLIKLRSGAFSITRQGKDMLKEEAAGRLYGALFLTHFRKLNLAYLDGYGENSELQQTLAMTFYRLRRLSPRWMSPAELAEELLMPQVLDPPSSDSGREDVYGQMESRVLTPLARFGLLDRKSVEGRYRFLPEMRYRRAPLFERFIRFRF